MSNKQERGLPQVVLIGSDPQYLLNFRRELIEELLDSGHEVITVSWACPPSIRAALLELGVRDHFEAPIRQGSLNPWGELKLTLSLFAKLRSVRPVCVIAYTAKPVVSGMIAAFMARIPRRVALVEGMGFAFTEGVDNKRKIARRLLSFGYAIALRLTTQIVVLNPSDLTDIAVISGRPDRRIGLVRGIGVPERYFRSEPIPCSPLRFLYVGRILVDKGLRELIDSCRILRAEGHDFEMVFVGAQDLNPAAYPEEDFRRDLQSIGANWTGPSDDVPGEIEKSHVLVLPSYREGFPRSVMEAMAGGRPVIVTDVPGCRDCVLHETTGLVVPPFNSRRLADAMRFLIMNPSEIERMGREAYAYARVHFDAKARASEVIAYAGLRRKA